MRRIGPVAGWLGLAVLLAGCLVEEAQQAADQIGTATYADMVSQFGAPAKKDRTFTGKLRATWTSRSTNAEGRVSQDRLILVFDDREVLKKVTYEDGRDDLYLINWLSRSFTCEERGNYPGGPSWKDERRSDLTPDTVPPRKSTREKPAEGWKSRK